MASSNDFCTFNFQNHFVQKPNSRKRNHDHFFKAYGKCMFNDCSCNCIVYMKNEMKTRSISVAYSGNIKHRAGERQSRYIKDDQRHELRKRFNKGPDKPSVVYQEKKSHLSLTLPQSLICAYFRCRNDSWECSKRIAEGLWNRESNTCKISRKVENGLNLSFFKRMDEVLDESGPLQSLENVLTDSCDELEVSMDNLSLCDANDGK